MIRTALEFITKELDAYIADRESDVAYTPGNIVDLKSIVAIGAEPEIDTTKHVTVMLVGVEEEIREGKVPVYTPIDDKEYYKFNPPVSVNLAVIFVASSSNYTTALRDLSSVICFFQANSVFDKNRNSDLNATVSDPVAKPWQLIERLSCKIKNLSTEQQNNIWSVLGNKYLPSIVYTISALNAFETRGKDKVSAILEAHYKDKVVHHDPI